MEENHEQKMQESGNRIAKPERYYLLSRHFTENWTNYVWQSLAAGLVSFVVIWIFSELIGLIILASIGSTFFTVFALPNNRTAQPRNVIGSYLICVLIGLACCFISSASISGGIAVGAAAFLMVITDTEHPPAAGIALGMALSPSIQLNLTGAALAVIAAVLASLLKRVLAPWLKDLI